MVHSPKTIQLGRREISSSKLAGIFFVKGQKRKLSSHRFGFLLVIRKLLVMPHIRVYSCFKNTLGFSISIISISKSVDKNKVMQEEIL